MELWIKIAGIIVGILFAWIGFLIEYPIRKRLRLNTRLKKFVYAIFAITFLLCMAILGNLITFIMVW